MRNKITNNNYKLLKISVMKNFYRIFIVMLAFAFTTNVSAQLEGAYKMAPEAASMGVGPSQGDMSWWANSASDVDTRACFFDDLYIFNEDGSFENILQDETWLETWQGVSEDGCGLPVAPHDGSGDYTYTYNSGDGTVTVNGTGAYIGLAKAFNGGELTSPGDAPASITYLIDIQDNGDVLIIDIEVDGAWWRFKMVADDYTPPTGSFEGMWQMQSAAGSMGVGPGQGDMSWWAIDDAGVAQRTCFFDDYYVFNGDGTFRNILQDETWLETWQGVAEDGCGTPVAPHDGTVNATWAYNGDAETVTLNGTGAYLGIPKAVNGSELSSPNDAPASVSYIVSFQDDGELMILDIESGSGVWWRFKLAYMGPVGLAEIENTAISLFPNPAQDFISVSENFESAQIFNISGSMVMNIEQNKSQIDISELSSGVYFIQINTVDGELKQKKFVKK